MKESAFPLRSRAGQLADHLRASLAAGSVAPPLPAMRRWSEQLGVSRRTLSAAIQDLRREGLISVHARGIRLNRGPAGALGARPAGPRFVRVLSCGPYRPGAHEQLETALRQRLLPHGVDLRWETCAPSRLREIARHPAAANELLILASVPPAYQRLFARSRKAALVLGEVAPGLALPFVNVEQPPVIRHAVFGLFQRGFDQVSLVYAAGSAPGIKRAVAAFAAACAEWPKQPVAGRAVPTALDPQSLSVTVRRLAEQTGGRRGFVVVAPVPIGMMVTALWRHGIAVPEQAEVAGLWQTPEAIKLYPPPVNYPFPTAAVTKHLSNAAVQYFDHGTLPPVHAGIVAEVAKRP